MRTFFLVVLAVSLVAYMGAGAGLYALEQHDVKYDTKLPREIEDLVERLGSESVREREDATKRLIRIGRPAVEALNDCVVNNENKFARMCSAAALGEIGDIAAVPALIKALGDRNIRVRAFSAKSLGDLADSSASAPLVTRVKKDDDALVRKNSALALGKIGNKKAVPVLIDALKGDESTDVRVATTESLAMLRDVSAVEPLYGALLDDKEVNVRIGCADALGKLGDKRGSPFLAEALNDDYAHQVRSACAFALITVGDNKSIAALIKALNDEYRDVVVYAQDALVSITGQNIKGYDNWHHWWKENKDLIE